ncbi:MAG: agmatinase [Chloroflexi bacterium]|nr:agmatinase [Chloroflexota bacterium]
MKANLFYPPRNFCALKPPYSDYNSAKFVIIPVSYESTIEIRSGTGDGPKAIIDASEELELYDDELDIDTFNAGIHTLPEVELVMSGPEFMVDRVYQVARDIVADNKIPVLLGGEHSITSGSVKAVREKYKNLSVLQLDAHADLRDSYLSIKYSHACVMRRVLEICPVVQVGLRSISYEDIQFIRQKELKPVLAETYLTKTKSSIEKIVNNLSDDVYITVDLDVFDPSEMAAVGTPEPGGLHWYEVLAILRAVSKVKRIVGFDVVELCPRDGPHACAFMAAKLAYKIMGYVQHVQ